MVNRKECPKVHALQFFAAFFFSSNFFSFWLSAFFLFNFFLGEKQAFLVPLADHDKMQTLHDLPVSRVTEQITVTPRDF